MAVGSGAVIAALLYQYEDSQYLPPHQIAKNQFRQLGVLATHAARHSPYFAGRLKNSGLTAAELATPEGFRRLSLLRREHIQNAGAALFCRALPEGHTPTTDNLSSGSTGEPVMVKRTAMNQIDWLTMTLRDHLWWRRDFSWREAAIRALTRVYAEREDWGSPTSLLFATGPAARIPITTDVAEQVRLLRAFAPDSLIVHPSNLDAIVQHCQRRGRTIPSLKCIRTLGETLWPHVREEAASFFNATVIDCYSSQELGYIALECPESGRYHVMAESLMVEVLDERDEPVGEGQMGRVVVTDLHNFATPLIRYDVGDVAEMGGACPCGRTLPVLNRVLGRERNLIVMPDGTRHWPMVGFHHVRSVAPVKQFQFIQWSRERIEARLAVEAPLTPQQEADVRALAQRVLGHPFALEVVYFDDRLPAGPGGKLEQFICKVQ